MAIEVAISDDFGNSYPNAYSKYDDFHINVRQKTIRVVFEKWKDKATRIAADEPGARLRPFDRTTYQIGPGRQLLDGGVTIPNFDDLATGDNSNPQGIGSLIYQIAKLFPENTGARDV